jgi:nitrite reductase/ring-hydroxylating ferredoxin subunit/uncharacterized membrane protein
MKSKAQIKGHPLHPMLIAFPLAFLVGGFVADVSGVLFDAPLLWETGRHLVIAGVVMGLVAAVPGIVDYVYVVPPRSSGRKRATQHMLSNLGAVALFVVAWLFRGPVTESPGVLVLGAEAVGVALLVVGGWLGGTLVYRNEIGVDRRYAGAGKWKEAKVEGSAGAPVRVASADELEVDQMKLLRVADQRIVLARTESGYVAFADHCPHRGGSLAGGSMICATVQCPWHGSQFDVRTGEVRAGPAAEGIVTYRVSEEGGEVRLHL